MKKLSVFCAFSVFCALLLSGFTSEVMSAPVDLTFGGLVSEETITKLGHQRISDKYADVLNVVEYENTDGTRTIYSFGTPVKYVDEHGKTQRINKQLNRSLLGNCWETSANWFDVSISNDFSRGVTLSCYDKSLVVVPVSPKNQSTFSRKKKMCLLKMRCCSTPTRRKLHILPPTQGIIPTLQR